jgi:hypothetical protein
MTKLTNPDQPIHTDKHGHRRFKGNMIVRHLLDNGGMNLNNLATMDFSNDDWMQFAQLIGYSVSGWGELSYVSNKRYERATKDE